MPLEFKANARDTSRKPYISLFPYLLLPIQLLNVWVSPPGTNNIEEDPFTGCLTLRKYRFPLYA